MAKGYEIRPPREEERAELFKVFYACFPAYVEVFRKLENNDRPIHDYLYGYEPLVMLMDGRIMANVSLIRYNIYLDGEIVPIGGIGSVVTHPDYQRKGYAKILLEQRLRDMISEGTHISVLMTELPWAYESRGWKIITQDYRIVDLSDHQDNQVDANIAIVEDPTEARSIISVYDAMAPTLNGAIKREPGYWEDYYFTGITGFVGSGDKFLFFKDGSELLGYVRLHHEETQVLLSEVIVKDWNAEVLEKLLGSAVRTVCDMGRDKMIVGLQENHPLKKQMGELGFESIVERPEGIREFTMVNSMNVFSPEDRYLKRLHWCYNDKF